MLVPLTGTEPKPSALEVQSLNHWTWEVPAMQFLGCMFNRFSRVQLFVTHGLWPARLLCPQDSPGKNTEVGYHDLLQEIFSTHGSNPHLPCLLHWQAVLYHLGVLISQLVKNPPAVQETPVRFLCQEDQLKKGWATHSSSWVSLVA